MTTLRRPVRMTASAGTVNRESAGAPATRIRSSMPGISLPLRLSTWNRAFNVRVLALISGRISSSVPVEGLRGIGLKHRIHLPAAGQVQGLRFGNLGHGPDRVQPRDPQERHAGRHGGAFADAEFRHDAACRRAEREACLRRAGRFALPDQFVGNRHRLQPVARRGDDLGRDARTFEGQQLVLRPEPFRREDRGERLTLAHPLHRRANLEPLHIACHARLHGDGDRTTTRPRRGEHWPVECRGSAAAPG